MLQQLPNPSLRVNLEMNQIFATAIYPKQVVDSVIGMEHELSRASIEERWDRFVEVGRLQRSILQQWAATES